MIWIGLKKLLNKEEPETIPSEPKTEVSPVVKRQYASDEINKHGEYIKTDSSPVPGMTLRHILHGDTNKIWRIAWSPDGKYLASPSMSDTAIWIWSIDTGTCVYILDFEGHGCHCLAWSPDSKKLVSAASGKPALIIWDVETQIMLLNFGQASHPTSILWSYTDNRIVLGESGCALENIQVFNSLNGNLLHKIYHPASHLPDSLSQVNNLLLSQDGKTLFSCSFDKRIFIWNLNSGEKLGVLKGASGILTCLESLNENILVSADGSSSILLWDLKKMKIARKIEGHTESINGLSFSSNKNLMASKSEDNTVRLWDTKNWELLASVSETYTHDWTNITFHPHLPILATLGEKETTIRIWELDETVLLGKAKQNINYTTAKLVLVGDSGVGKTGLGWRMAHDEFKEHASTHGQQFWPIQQLNLKRNDDTDCEAVLWDLAGQHVYRQVHSIFLENVAAALVLFDPTNRQDPLKGARFWLEQLKGKGKLPPTILVGARVDRGSPALSQDELDQFCQQYGIKGGYLSTSAKAGDGLPELLDILKEQIPWDDMTATVTTVTFKRIKNYVLSLKEKTDRKGGKRSRHKPRASRQPEVKWKLKRNRFTRQSLLANLPHHCQITHTQLLSCAG